MGNSKKKEIKAGDFESIINIIKNDMKDFGPIEVEARELQCRVCGFEYSEEDAPWKKMDGNWFSSNDLCVCCNVQFGYEDGEGGVSNYREKWISDGGIFHHKVMMPKDWSLEAQLKNIPEQWRNTNA
jgi:hypothetical protein